MSTTMQLPETDAEGYLVEPLNWTEEVAVALARQENIQLTEDHWDAIRFMREYYMEHQVAADARPAQPGAPTSPSATNGEATRMPTGTSALPVLLQRGCLRSSLLSRYFHISLNRTLQILTGSESFKLL